MLGCCLALAETKDLCVNRLDLKCQIMLGLANVGLIWDVQIRFWLAWPSWDGGWLGLGWSDLQIVGRNHVWPPSLA